MKKEDIPQALKSMDHCMGKQTLAFFELLTEHYVYMPVIQDANDFFMNIMFPHEKVLRQLIRGKYGNNPDVEFILLNQKFISSHFKKWIYKFEGSCCIANKCRTLIERLFVFYIDGKEIFFDHSDEKSFAYPVNIFSKHEEIINFYVAIRKLAGGHCESYLPIVKKLNEKQNGLNK